MYVIMNLMHLASQISKSYIQMAYYLTLTTHTQIINAYGMI